MEEFEELLAAERAAVERYVRFRLDCPADAEDVLQETYLAAYQKFPQLKNRDAFKSWLLSIARNKCADCFRERAARREISVEELAGWEPPDGGGIPEGNGVRETLELLGGRDREILGLYFWRELPQAEIARRLDIPVGTVKSRLHAAKRRFRSKYPYDRGKSKGERAMKTLPEILPAYKIEHSGEAPFPVKWEELMGWFLVPKIGEKLSWGMYDMPSRRCACVYDMEVVGGARVHGVEGVEVTARETPRSGESEAAVHTFVAQLTDAHCRYLAAVRNDSGVKEYVTFLDGDAFLPGWGFGEDNCGNETNLWQKGVLQREGAAVTAPDRPFLLDIVGRYNVTINGKNYDTVCVMVLESARCGAVSEQYLDRNGRTVLWRRFNRDDWAMDRYHKRWSEQFPDNERLSINGEVYVHWYDCVTDYIF